MECPNCGQLEGEVQRLTNILNTPMYDVFLEAVKSEGAHQIWRWGEDHDSGKEPQDWYWLIGYLAGKALRAEIDGNKKKALHHTISSAAVLMQWHRAIQSIDVGDVGIDATEDLKEHGGLHANSMV